MSRLEDAIQCAVFDHIRVRGSRDLVAWHTPNGGKRNRIEAARFKGLGVRAGVSDVVALHRGRIVALELKAPGGLATEAQLKVIADMNRAGAPTCVADGLDDALTVVESWGLLGGATH